MVTVESVVSAIPSHLRLAYDVFDETDKRGKATVYVIASNRAAPNHAVVLNALSDAGYIVPSSVNHRCPADALDHTDPVPVKDHFNGINNGCTKATWTMDVVAGHSAPRGGYIVDREGRYWTRISEGVYRSDVGCVMGALDIEAAYGILVRG